MRMNIYQIWWVDKCDGKEGKALAFDRDSLFKICWGLSQLSTVVEVKVFKDGQILHPGELGFGSIEKWK
jgi:hypothetical protein